MTSKEIDLYLEKLYHSLDLPSSYASKNTLPDGSGKIPRIETHKVEKWLSKQLTYTLHKLLYQTFQTRPVIVYSIDELWQLDLVDLSKLDRENDGHKFILSITDVLSKYGWLLPLKSKYSNEIKGVLTKLFEQTNRRLVMVQTDKGTEFLNSHVWNFF